MTKQREDKFTIDAFDAPRRGRPPVLNPKTLAQRSREYRARKKVGFTDPVKQARSHSSELKSFSLRLLAMSADWGEVDEHFRFQLEQISHSVSELEQELSDFVACDGVFE